MVCMKKCIFFVLPLLIISLAPLSLCKDVLAASGPQQSQAYSPMSEPGAKVHIGGGYYLIYGFDKKPSWAR